MPVVSIHVLAVFIAAIVGMAIGFLWYGPLFGRSWMALIGISPAQMNATKAKGLTKSYLVNFIGVLVMSYVLAHALVFASAYENITGASAGLMVGFWSWFGFIAPVTMGSVLWEEKSWRLWCINNGYYFVSLVAMGCILAAWQ